MGESVGEARDKTGMKEEAWKATKMKKNEIQGERKRRIGRREGKGKDRSGLWNERRRRGIEDRQDRIEEEEEEEGMEEHGGTKKKG